MKRTIYIALTFLALTLFAIPQRGIESARYLVFSDDSAPTAADYVQEGLVYLFDGIENVGWGMHDSDSTEWVNLVSGQLLSLSTSHHFGSDRMTAQTGAPTLYFPITLGGTENRTLEVVAHYPDTSATEISILGLNLGGDRIYATWYANGNVSFRSRFNSSGTSVVQSRTNARNVFSATFSRDFSEDLVSFFTNGKLFRAATATYESPATRAQIYAGKVEANFFCIRIYNRNLSASEVAYNYLIDRLRFNLP